MYTIDELLNLAHLTREEAGAIPLGNVPHLAKPSKELSEREWYARHQLYLAVCVRVGIRFPKDVACPLCGAQPGRGCIRDSGHQLSGRIDGWDHMHTARWDVVGGRDLRNEELEALKAELARYDWGRPIIAELPTRTMQQQLL